MKSTLLISVLLYFLGSNCKKHTYISLNKTSTKQIIAIQPLGNYDEAILLSVAKEISIFYNKRVILFKPIEIPKTFLNAISNQYSADSIIHFLSGLRNDSIVEIVGITHTGIYTIKKNKNMSFFDENIFGMGYLPGNSCIISDIKFWPNDSAVYNYGLRKIIKHEIGHNAGLPHCSDSNCIMSETNGHFSNLDHIEKDYCIKCKIKLSR